MNLLSHMVMSQLLIPYLKQQSNAKLIFMGSEAALKGAQQGSIYCAAKFGLRGFAQSLRQECSKSGLSVTLINPGMIKTPFFNDLYFEPGPGNRK